MKLGLQYLMAISQAARGQTWLTGWVLSSVDIQQSPVVPKEVDRFLRTGSGFVRAGRMAAPERPCSRWCSLGRASRRLETDIDSRDARVSLDACPRDRQRPRNQMFRISVSLVVLFLVGCSTFPSGSAVPLPERIERFALLMQRTSAPEYEKEKVGDDIITDLEAASDQDLDAVFVRSTVETLVKLLDSERLDPEPGMGAYVTIWLSIASKRAGDAAPALIRMIERLDILYPFQPEEGLLGKRPNFVGRTCDALGFVTGKSPKEVGTCDHRFGYWPDNIWRK